MKIKRIAAVLCVVSILVVGCVSPPQSGTKKLPDAVRAEQVKDLKFGMFICWSFSTFSGQEWTRGVDDVAFFKATGCDTDQWCRTAKEAGMNYILFLTKHHDGFCLWDTDTTDFKVTNSPLGIDVLAKLRKSCDKYGIKLALYFSEADWSWIKEETPVAGTTRSHKEWRNPIWRTGQDTELKKAQLEELCTRYGPIEFFWMDHAQSDGGLDHAQTAEWVRRFQPNCFVGFNHGDPAGRLCIRERGRPGKIGDASTTKYNKDAEKGYKGYLVAEFTYPILPPHKGGAQWFYSLPEHDALCHPAEKLYADYVGAVEYGNIFSLDVGPNYEGKLRDIDVETLRKVGEMIRNPPPPPPPPLPVAGVTASSVWNEEYAPSMATDGDLLTRWGAKPKSRSGWLELDLGEARTVSEIRISECGFPRTQEFKVEFKRGGKWEVLLEGTTIGGDRRYSVDPAKARRVRLSILKASEVPSFEEFQVFGD